MLKSFPLSGVRIKKRSTPSFLIPIYRGGVPLQLGSYVWRRSRTLGTEKVSPGIYQH